MCGSTSQLTKNSVRHFASKLSEIATATDLPSKPNSLRCHANLFETLANSCERFCETSIVDGAAM